MSQHRSIGLSCNAGLVVGVVGKLGGGLSTWAALPVWIRLSELFCVLFSNNCNAINIFHFQNFALLSVVCMMAVF